MHFFSPPFLLLLPTLTLCLPQPQPQPQQQLDFWPNAQSVIDSVNNINAAVLDLDVSVQNYTGGSLRISIVENKRMLAGIAKINAVNRQGFHRAMLSTPWSVEDTVGFVDAVSGTVNISIPTSVAHLCAKKGLFKEYNADKVIVASLMLLLYDHDTFSTAAGKNFNPGTKMAKIREVSEASENIHDVIQDAIRFYNRDN